MQTWISDCAEVYLLILVGCFVPTMAHGANMLGGYGHGFCLEANFEFDLNKA